MSSKISRAILSLFVPTLLLAMTACPGVIVDHIQVTFDANGAIIGATISFNCISPITSDIATYLWFFGDGATAKGKTVMHSYSSAGGFLVECHVITRDDVLIFTKSINIRLGFSTIYWSNIAGVNTLVEPTSTQQVSTPILSLG